MRLAAFSLPADPDARRVGILDGATLRDITPAVGSDLTVLLDRVPDLVSLAEASVLSLAEVSLRAPLLRPGKIICVGLNYHDHCREQGVEAPAYPMLFAKFANAVSDPGSVVVRPAATDKLDLECELAVIIGRGGSHIPKGQALEHVFGYTVLNDITARDLQREDRQWLRAKGWDGFAPMGPMIVTADELGDPGNLTVRSWVNGEPWQDSSTVNMIWDVATLIAFISRSIRLEPGDVLATGTPAGVGHFHDPPRYLADGDEIECDIGGIGRLTTRIRDEHPRAADHLTAAGVGSL